MNSVASAAPMAGVPAAVADKLELIARDIELTQSAAVLHVGERLHQAREIFRYERNEGGFAGWIEHRLGMSRSTAYNVLSVWERFGASESVQLLDTLPKLVLYALAAPSTPDEVREQVEERVSAGETVTLEEVNALKEQWAVERKDLKRQLDDAKFKTRDAKSTRNDIQQQLTDLQRELSSLRDQNDTLRHELDHAKRIAATASPGFATIGASERAPELDSVEGQVETLLSDWGRVSPKAREEFLRRIDAPKLMRGAA